MRGRALVTGATGAVGPAVVDALLQAGWRVRLLVRGTCDRTDVEIVQGDLRDPDSLRKAVDGVDCVVHMAGLLHIVDAGKELDAEFRALNVDATRTLVEASRGIRFVFFSSISVYGSDGPFDETSPVNPQTSYARTKVEAEKIVIDAGGTVLRIAAVYGDRMKGNYASLVRAIHRRLFLPIGAGTNHRTLVHDRDVGRAVVLVLTSERAARQIYNVTDGTTHSIAEIVEAISAGFGRRGPRLRVPVLAVRAVGAVVPGVARLLERYREEVRVDGSKIRRELGFRPEADFRAAWREAVRKSS